MSEYTHGLPQESYGGYRPDEEALERAWSRPPGWRGPLMVVNHRTVGRRFIVTGIIFLILGGIQALMMRTQLAQPELDLISTELFQQLFSMHGTTMVFLFAVPIFEGVAMYLIPLMVGARDMSMPRLSAFGYWLYLIAGVTLFTSFFLGVAPDAGWFAHAPLSSDRSFTPQMGMDVWATAISLLEISALAAAVEIVVTILKMRAPGMSLSRMPVLVWAMLVMAMMIIVAMPAALLASITVAMDRMAGTHFFNAAMGGDPVLYKHLFWFFGHPEVYIIFVPALGVVAMVLMAMVRRPIMGYTLVNMALVAMGLLSFGLWAHHFFAVGLPPIVLSFFAVASVLVAIPSGIHIFSFLATTWYGRPRFKAPFLFLLGFVLVFMAGGVTGIMLAAVPVNLQVHDSYFVVAHLHYVLIGGAVFPLFAGLYYWFPKITGYMLNERIGRWQFWLMLIGMNMTFFIQHHLGLTGMSRRIQPYSNDMGWGTLNLISTIGSYILAIGIFLFVVNVFVSRRQGQPAGNDPWGGPTLEWATTSPPPKFNWLYLPVVRARYPLWEEPQAPAGRETAADRAIRLLPQFDDTVRETWGTDAITAEPESRIDLPGPSIWPLLAALSVSVAFIGLLWSFWFVPIGAFLFYLSMIGWHWPFNKELAT